MSGTKTLTLGVVQLALEATLSGNRDKIVRLIAEAKSKGCRLVVFPENALQPEEHATPDEIDAAVEEVRRAARAHAIYVMLCVLYRRTVDERLFNRMLVV